MKLQGFKLISLLASGIVLLASPSAFAASSADMNKTLRYYFRAAETAFDPAKYSDAYSDSVMLQIFEALYDYDYLARPLKLRPKTAAALPEMSPDGKTFIIKLKPGIFFADDPAFGGKKRELVAQDYVYSLQRTVDTNNRGAPWDFMLKGKVIGLDAKIEAGTKTSKFDYDKPIEGLKALDKYTLQIKLTKSDFNMPYILAAPATSAVAREVIEKYGDDAEAHPVGTGPYKLRSWQRRNRIVLEANPDFRGEVYKPEPGATGIDPVALKEIQGKTFPRIGVIDIRIIETPQSAWLSFDDGGLDIGAEIGFNYASTVAPGNKLAPKYAQRGWQYYREVSPSIQVKMFNMDDPVVGGYTPEKVALRRAFVMAFNTAKNIWILKNGQAVEANSPIPPPVIGYDPNFVNELGAYNPAKANALLDVFGYKDCDGDGWREAPGCKPLNIEYLTSIGADSRDEEELVQKTWAAIKIRSGVKKVQFPDLVSARNNGQYQQSVFVWSADYPDAENFMQLLYGPNAGPANNARFKLDAFDALYREIASMAESPERDDKLRQMSRLTAAYAPWAYEFHTTFTYLAQPWVQGYRPHPDQFPHFMYLDIDLDKRAAVLGNQPH
ncbi:MAG: ABC transporter substrate-binding protein [Rhodoferax sp.]